MKYIGRVVDLICVTVYSFIIKYAVIDQTWIFNDEKGKWMAAWVIGGLYFNLIKTSEEEK